MAEITKIWPKMTKMRNFSVYLGYEKGSAGGGPLCLACRLCYSQGISFQVIANRFSGVPAMSETTLESLGCGPEDL